MNGSERLRYRKVPKVVDVICSKLIEVAKKDAHQVAFAFINLPDWFDIQGDKELLKLKVSKTSLKCWLFTEPLKLLIA